MTTQNHSTTLTVRSFRLEGEKNPHEECLKWIHATKTKIERARYGNNRQAVQEAMEDLADRRSLVDGYKTTVDKVMQQTGDDEKKQQLEAAYAQLVETLDKKSACLETMREITSLEEHCGNLHRIMDTSAVTLVKPEDRMGEDLPGSNNLGFVAPSSQDCIFAVQDNWEWVVKLVKCIDIHLKNGSTYHQFFHEVDESSHWMQEDLKRLHNSFELKPLDGNYQDAAKLLQELKELSVALRQWEVKVNRIWDTGVKVVPVHLRVHGTEEPHPARILADYENAEVRVREGEDVLLLDNSNATMWKIRNARGQEVTVPALIVLIPGPHKAAVDAAVQMKLKLLAAWTDTLKRLGKRLICFMLMVFKPDYSVNEINIMKGIPPLDKQDLLRILEHIEDTLKVHWSDHEGFLSLQERVLMLRMILEEGGDILDDEERYKALVVQITMLEKLMDNYKDLWKDWEKYKVALEASRSPELMLVVDKWEQLQFVNRANFANFDDNGARGGRRPPITADTARRFWQSELPFDEMEKTLSGLKEMTVRGAALHGALTETDEVEEEGVGGLEEQLQGMMAATVGSVPGALYGSAGEGMQEVREGNVTVVQVGGGGEGSGGNTVITQTLRMGGDAEEGTTGEGMEETRVVTEKVTVSGVDAGTAGEGMDETRVVTKTFTVSGGGGGDGGGTSEEGFSETVTATTTTSYAAGADGSGGAGRGLQRRQIVSSSSLEGTGEDGIFEEGVEEVATGWEHQRTRASASSIDSTDFGMATETKTAETEQLSKAEMEERKTFVIRSVVNPEDQSEISLQEAIRMGVINPHEGIYVNKMTGETVPIPVAMGAGLIKVMFTSVRRTQEKKSSIGLITVKTIRETVRPYTIKSVKDTARGASLTQSEAADAEILDERRGSYLDTASGKRMLMSEAIEKGHMEVEYEGEAPTPEVHSQAYAVRAVVDRRLKKVITFHDAVRRGIIDKESGAYKDTLTGESMYVGDAIMRGFLKARPITDTNSLEVDPVNQMLIDKTETIRKKLIQPLKVISAFKRAALKK